MLIHAAGLQLEILRPIDGNGDCWYATIASLIEVFGIEFTTDIETLRREIANFGLDYPNSSSHAFQLRKVLWQVLPFQMFDQSEDS